MANENLKNEQNQDQEDLAKAWEEALAQQQAQEGQNSQNDTNSPQSEEDIMKMWQEAMGSTPAAEETTSNESVLPSDTSSEVSELPPDWEILADIPLELSVEIGDTEMPIGDIIKLQPTSIIELRRKVNEPVDVKINGKLVAKAELYVNEDRWAIKIIQIISPEERLKLARELHEG